MQKLHTYLVENNPDILVHLQSAQRVTSYLQVKVASVMPIAEALLGADNEPYAIEERCMEEMTADLRPSRYHLLATLLAEEFEEQYTLLREAGTLTLEIINIMPLCDQVLQSIPLAEENEDNRFLQYALIGCIQEYFDSRETTTVRETTEGGDNGIQSIPETKR